MAQKQTPVQLDRSKLLGFRLDPVKSNPSQAGAKFGTKIGAKFGSKGGIMPAR